jgi:predicted metalloprotease with PDZ domain
LLQLFDERGIVFGLRPAEESKDSGGNAPKAERPAGAWLGANLLNRNGKHSIATVHSGSPAELAGLASGDELVALDNLKFTAANADSLLRDYRKDDVVTIAVFRGDELLRFRTTLAAPPEDTCYLLLAENPSAAALARRTAWLTGESSA